MKRYSVAIGLIKITPDKIHSALRMMICSANSEAEALGMLMISAEVTELINDGYRQETKVIITL